MADGTLSGSDYCIMEGCVYKGRSATCLRCGRTNYPLLGYYGAVGFWAKRWGLTREEAEARIGTTTPRRRR